MKWMSLDELTAPGVYWVRDASGLRIGHEVPANESCAKRVCLCNRGNPKRL
jgi:hypothetical protein